MATRVDFMRRQLRAARRARLVGILVPLLWALLSAAVSAVLVIVGFGLWTLALEIDVRRIPDSLLAWAFGLSLGVTLLAAVGIILYGFRLSKLPGERIARLLGAERALGEPARKLLNVVEEMAIASGMPVPTLYVLDWQLSVNALAAGSAPANAVVVLTRGCRNDLTRDELQAVVAHCLSRIVQGDTRADGYRLGLNRAFGVLDRYLGLCFGGGIGVPSWRKRLATLEQEREWLYYIVLFVSFIAWLWMLPLVLAYLVCWGGSVAARGVQALVLRNRSLVADAAAVQFTRNPAGLVGVFRRLLEGRGGVLTGNQTASEMAHMFFVSPKTPAWLRTHPRLAERIELTLQDAPELARQGGEPAEAEIGVVAAVTGLVQAYQGPMPGVFSLDGPVGGRTAVTVEAVRKNLDSIPKALREKLDDSFGASACVLALLMDKDEAVRKRQRQLIEQLRPPVWRKDLEEFEGLVRSLEPKLRLPLLELCIPALRDLTPEKRAVLLQCVDALVLADSRTSMFEFLLAFLLERYEAGFDGPPPPERALTDHELHAQARVLLGALARCGTLDEAGQAAAFSAGAAVLGPAVSLGGTPTPDEIGFDRLGHAMTLVSHCSGVQRNQLWKACMACVLFDGKVRPQEADLVRVLGRGLGIPVPATAGEE